VREAGNGRILGIKDNFGLEIGRKGGGRNSSFKVSGNFHPRRTIYQSGAGADWEGGGGGRRRNVTRLMLNRVGSDRPEKKEKKK